MEVSSADLLRGQSPTLESLTKTAEVMTAAFTLHPRMRDSLATTGIAHAATPQAFVTFRIVTVLEPLCQPLIPDRLLLQLLLGSRRPLNLYELA